VGVGRETLWGLAERGCGGVGLGRGCGGVGYRERGGERLGKWVARCCGGG
jgi:hypothetical protein